MLGKEVPEIMSLKAYRDFSGIHNHADEAYNASLNRKILTYMSTLYMYSRAGREFQCILRQAGKMSDHPALLTFGFCEVRKYTRIGHAYHGSKVDAEQRFKSFRTRHPTVRVKDIVLERKNIREASGHLVWASCGGA